MATGWQLWRQGSGRAWSHEALLWSSRSAVRLSSPDGAPRSRSPRRPFRTLSDQPQWLPVVQSRPRPAGNGVAGAMHLRSRDRGCIARRSRSTKEPRALLRCAALAELTHHLDLDLAKRSGGCSSETTRARTLALQSGAGWGRRRPRIASAWPAATSLPSATTSTDHLTVCHHHQSGVTTWILLLLLPRFVVRLWGCLQLGPW